MIDHTFAVPGLSSGGAQYVRGVADAVFAIPGVHAVGIDQAGATLTVTSSRPIDDAELSAAIDETPAVPSRQRNDPTSPASVAPKATDLATAWAAERDAARAARERGDLGAEWRHLERAHILSQPMAVLHVRTHVAMLAAGIRRHDRREVARPAAAPRSSPAPGRWTGRYPVGNTGGADVSALAPMPIPDDLAPVPRRPPPTPRTSHEPHDRPPGHLLHRHRAASRPAPLRPSSSSATATASTCASRRSPSSSATTGCACSPTTGRSPDRRSGSGKASEITVHVRNDADTEATVHWHGLRARQPLRRRPPRDPGADPDRRRVHLPAPVPRPRPLLVPPPHPRGLRPRHGPVRQHRRRPRRRATTGRRSNREVTSSPSTTSSSKTAGSRRSTSTGPTHVAMGRFGNVMLTGGDTNLDLDAHAGEVVRFYFTNTANTRLFNVALPGARMKLVGGDSGRYEHETFVDEVLLAPSERAIVDVLFDVARHVPARAPHTRATPTCSAPSPSTRPPVEHVRSASEFELLRTAAELTAERARIEADGTAPPDKTLAFESLMPLLYGDPDADGIDAWTCPMHPDVVSDEPGHLPVMRDEAHPRRAGAAPSDGHAHGHAPRPRRPRRPGVGGPDAGDQPGVGLVQHDLEARRPRHRQGERGDRLDVPSRRPR